MKKLIYLASFVGMLFASCSNDDFVPETTTTGGGEMVTNYISVNIIPTSGTRADNDQKDDGLYRDGESYENKVNSVRFFFFTANGDAAPVKKVTSTQEDAYVSFIDWYPEGSGGASIPNETVEATYVATLGIFVHGEAKYKPTSVVAVINPSDYVIETASQTTVGNVKGPSLAELEGYVANYEKGLVDNNFVMSNSAYVNTTTGEKELATSIADSKFKDSAAAAFADPITIYVERVVARLDLSIDLELTNGLYLLPMVDPVTGREVEEVTIDGNPETVYIKFLGWNVTSTATKSNLLKNINSAWTNNALFAKEGETTTTAWNNPTFHRSFWAMNPEEAGISYGNFNGNADNDNLYPATAMTMSDKTIYLQENASPYNKTAAPTSPTKVILAYQLVKEDGTPIRLAEWAFQKYTIDALKDYLIGTICEEKFYVKTSITEDGQAKTKYTLLTKADFKFISAQERFKDKEKFPDGVKNYYSYLVLDDKYNTSVNLTKGEGEAAEPITAAKINDYLLETVNYAMIWEQGYSYYYFDVHHLGAEGSVGYNGIVRNHIYETHVKSIKGIGTPVLDPSETIYPEKPEHEESIIAAEIKILQWRVVSGDYKIQW